MASIPVELLRKSEAMEQEKRGVRTVVRVVSKPVPKRDRAKCEARTRAGGKCAAPVVAGRNRCRLHGGLSTGPTSPAGRQAVAESNRRRAGARQKVNISTNGGA